MILEAIANLVDNAINHGRAGGQVVVANEIIDGEPVVSIADDGSGIPADQYEHVFKRFYRLEPSRSTPGNALRPSPAPPAPPLLRPPTPPPYNPPAPHP